MHLPVLTDSRTPSTHDDVNGCTEKTNWHTGNRIFHTSAWTNRAIAHAQPSLLPWPDQCVNTARLGKKKRKNKSVSSGAKERRGSLVNSCHLSSEPPGSHWGSLQAIHHSTCMQEVTHTAARELFFLQQRAQIVQLQFSCSLFLSESDGTRWATGKRYIWLVCYRCFCWPFRLPAPSACLMVEWQIQSNKI